MKPEILFEDEYLLAINKPNGMVVNRGFGAGETVQEWAEGKGITGSTSTTGSTGDDFHKRNGVVHRLDKETSGVLLIAKTPEAFGELQRQFKDREVEKVYIGLVHGHVEPQSGVVEAAIGRNPKNRMKFSTVEGGRDAQTGYRVIAHFSARSEERRLKSATTKVGFNTQDEYTLVEFYPKTGRTHQIRVHAKHIGHPIVSDYQYAGRKTTRGDRKWCPRLFLHAEKLSFKHPKSGERMTVEAPMPHDLKDVLANLSSRAD